MNALDFIATLDGISDKALDMLDASGCASLPVVWNSRLTSTAGQCHWRRNEAGRAVASKLDLNPKLRLEGAKAIRATFLHELAHAIAGNAAHHGADWKRTLRMLGGEATRCHKYASMTRKSQPKKLVGRCERCDFEIFKARRLTHGSFTHRGCGGLIIRTL